MPRLLYLLRHAKASPDAAGLDDIERPLAPAGEFAADKMRRYIEVADIRPDIVFCSTALRARRTLDRIGPALGRRVTTTHTPDLYGGEPETVVDLLGTAGQGANSIMVVGHNPGLQALATDLTRGDDGSERAQLAAKFPAGALATLVFRGSSWRDLDTGTCELHSLVHPRDIRADP
jgi:phosphohistidine phosphatase